jgi:hypothetical protein
MEQRRVRSMRAKDAFLGRARTATIVGLVVGALGIAVLWASGVEFPVYPPPGMVLLTAGAVLVGMARRPWVPAVGAFLGLFVIVGFLISPTGLSNLTGEAGTSVAIGQGIQVVGVITALIAGALATRASYRKPDRARETSGRTNVDGRD